MVKNVKSAFLIVENMEWDDISNVQNANKDAKKVTSGDLYILTFFTLYYEKQI